MTSRALEEGVWYTNIQILKNRYTFKFHPVYNIQISKLQYTGNLYFPIYQYTIFIAIYNIQISNYQYTGFLTNIHYTENWYSIALHLASTGPVQWPCAGEILPLP